MTPAPLRGVRAAFIFMTRLPIGGFPYSQADFSWAPAHFPLVGLVVGGLAALPLLLVHQLGSLLVCSLSLTFSLWLTGAFHEDGLADTADALGGAHSRKKIHEILKDSRIGTYGASALVLSLLLRLFSLHELLNGMTQARGSVVSYPVLLVAALLMLVHLLARTGAVGLMATMPYVAGEGAKGPGVARGGDLPQLLVALLWAAMALLALYVAGLKWGVIVSLLVGVLVISALMRRWFLARAGGFTGDFLGATEQSLEIALLLILVFAQPLRCWVPV